MNYTGTISHTSSGLQCLMWSAFNNYNQTETTTNLDDVDGNDNINYCRNPDSNPVGPWCYTDILHKQFCPIPICTVPAELNEIYIKNPQMSYKKTKLWDIAYYMRLVAAPTCLTLGGILNSLSIAVFTRPSLKESTTSLILICLAIFDTLTLYGRSFPRWLRLITSWKLESHSDLSCNVYFYLQFLASAMSSWLLVILSTERLIAILKPLEVKIISTKKNFSLICVCVFICMAFIDIPVIFGVKSKYEVIFSSDDIHFMIFRDCRRCCLRDNTAIQMILVLSNLFIPFVIILFGNIVIVVLLSKRQQTLEAMVSNTKAVEDLRKLISLTKLLLLVTFSYYS